MGRVQARYRVALRADDGEISLVSPFAVGDLNDNDNNHDLCLAQAGTPVEVRFPAGYVFDPNGDVNEDTRIRVGVGDLPVGVAETH